MGRTSSSRRLGWALTAQGRGRLGENGHRKGLAQVLRGRPHEAGTPCASSHSTDKPCTLGVQPC